MTDTPGQGRRLLPLRAPAQKVWDRRDPALSWADFKKLADQV
ncbi:hypothetical protein [Streptomyces chrestomyceticus]|nr:hypothetical protein [Streptomyces chrestomyceticus]